MIELVKALCALGERQGPQALRAARIIIRALERANVPYKIEQVEAHLPVATSKLTADGRSIDSAPTAFVPGRIDDAAALTSSLIPSRYLIDVPNINVNPSSKALSRSNFYFAPSLAIRKTDVPKLLKASHVRGEVRVRKARYALPQILVGNTEDPSTILFTHFDSLGPGAIDNASGTAVCLALALEESEILKRALIVFDPNEELSFDHPTYWGHGYREFERRHPKLLQKARRIISIDSVGNGKPSVIRDPKILNLAFPIKGLARLQQKTLTIAGDIEGLMKVYHSEADLPRLLSERYLEQARALARSLIR